MSATAEKNSIKIPPFHYIHVLDRNTNVSRLEIGPQTFIRQDHEKIQTGDKPIRMVVIPPRCYCEISDPVVRDEKGNVMYDKYNQAVVRHGEVELRFSEKYPDPFPLYPRESLSLAPTKLKIVQENTALRLEAKRDFKDDKGNQVRAGDRWLFEGPGTYYPRVEVEIVETVKAQIIGQQQALRLRATVDLVDRDGNPRKTGEEWLIRKSGSYLPGVYEEIVELQTAFTITNTMAISLRATQNFTDFYGKERKAGEEWLVHNGMSSYHVRDIFEEYVGDVPVTVLSKLEYCVVLDPFDIKTGKNRLGSKELRCGECSFFLQPGESLQGGAPKKVYLLGDDQALLLKAKEYFVDKKPGAKDAERQPGDKWMEYGPCTYIPPVEVEVLELRKKIPLDMNEGIYIRDTRTGLVRAHIGETYMLLPHEELAEVDLPEATEELLKPNYPTGKRDKTRVVTFRCPYNSAVQVYDYKKKKSRVVFGPDLVMLGPDEQFTVTVLSGSKPKRPGVIKTLYIGMGPDFSTDIIVVETTDHARLKLQLSYNWYFKVENRDNPEEASSIFNVKDFIGEMCNLMAGKVRAAVASVSFEAFHKSSAKLIRKSIFGTDDQGKIKDSFVFPQNNLIITNVDIQSVEPVDEKTQKSLQASVTLAIERTTKNQEDRARRQSDKQSQEAKGELEKQRIEDEAKNEELKKRLLQLQAESDEVKNSGQFKAEAKARAEAEAIKAQMRVQVAEFRARALKLQKEAELNTWIARQNADIQYEREMAELEVKRSKELAQVESEKFEQLVASIGQDTLVAMANAGPEMQAKLLQGLGLSGFIMTDGNNPINLFNTANGLLGNTGDESTVA